MGSQTAAEKEKAAKFYKVGVVNEGTYKDGEVIVGIVQPAGTSPTICLRFIRVANQYTLIKKNSSEIEAGDGINQTKFTVDSSFLIPGLEFAKSIQDKENEETFTKDTSKFVMFDETNLVKAFKHDLLGDIYTTKNQKIDSETVKSTPLDTNGFYAKALDGTAVIYRLQLSFMAKGTIPEVTFNAGGRNGADYNYTDHTGCGSSNYLSVPGVSKSELKKIGTNKWGDPIYGYIDQNHAQLKAYYKSYADGFYSDNGSVVNTYAQFIETNPIFFWENAYGQLVRFKNKTFEPMAECGKPVIYLYPKEKTRVSVKLYPVGGFSYTEPEYGAGWDVLADPDGVLTEVKSGKKYPYLFWEGDGGLYKTPERGFVVSRDGVHKLLTEKLSKYGLNEKEIADFQEFWEPKMKSKPYYFVTFLGNRSMNQIAPLDINPRPDTVIRVLMDFTPLDKPINVPGYEIVTPERNGFTVVEWGGVIRN